jgi:hypothetical protein
VRGAAARRGRALRYAILAGSPTSPATPADWDQESSVPETEQRSVRLPSAARMGGEATLKTRAGVMIPRSSGLPSIDPDLVPVALSAPSKRPATLDRRLGFGCAGGRRPPKMPSSNSMNHGKCGMKVATVQGDRRCDDKTDEG